MTVDYPYYSFNVNVIHKCGFMMNQFFYLFLYKYLCSTVIVLLSRSELLLRVCCCQVVILIKADFNLLITGIQACGLRSIVRLLHLPWVIDSQFFLTYMYYCAELAYIIY